MTEKEISELYIRLAFQYESAIDILLTKRLIDTELAIATKEKFYNTLDEEKLRSSKRIRDYHETIRLYMRRMTCNANQGLKRGRKTAQKSGEYKHMGNKTYIALLRCQRQ